MSRVILAWALAGVFASSANAQAVSRDGPVKAPVLLNREAISRERDRLSEKLVGKHDTVTVRVFVLIDTHGNIHQPEVKDPVKDRRLVRAAIALVTYMHFSPALQNGTPRAVLLTIPVRFAHARTK